MNSIPEWFASVCQNPERVVTEFNRAVSDSHKDERFDDLFFLFGEINFERIKSFLPKKMSQKVYDLFSKKQKRFEQIWKLCVPSLIKQSPLNNSQLKDLYEVSAYGGSDPRSLLIRDLSIYFLSQSMPIQQCKAFTCYEITPLKMHIDAYTKTLEKVVLLLFRLSSKNCSHSLKELTLYERCALFKSGALEFQKTKYSWGVLLDYWSKISGNKAVMATIQTTFCLDKLLIKENEVFPWFLKKPCEYSFKKFIVESTLNLLFRDKASPFPYVESICKDLEKAFFSSYSDEERTCAIYYIDSLFLWFQKNRVSFPTALDMLNSLLSNQKETVYNFLHAGLHYFYALTVLNVEKESLCKKVLWEAIYAVPLEKRKFFDQPLIEKQSLSSFLLDRESASFINGNRMSLDRWGEMFLRFSRRKVLGNHPNSGLSFQDHLLLIESIEILIGQSLPEAFTADLLFFQTVNIEILGVVERFKIFKKKVLDCCLEELDIFHERELEALSLEWVKQWVSPSLVFPERTSYKTRMDEFSRVPVHIARILQTLIYPKPFVFLKELIPEKIEMTTESCQLILSDAGCDRHERWQLFEPTCTTGPLWKGNWNLKKEEVYLTVSVVNSLQSLQTCTFSLKLPAEMKRDLSRFRYFLEGVSLKPISHQEMAFARRFHALFLRAFYLALFDWNVFQTPSLEIATLKASEKGFFLQELAAEVNYGDYAPSLEEFYLSQNREAIFHLEKGNTLCLNLSSESYLEDFSSWKIVQATWTLSVNEKEYISTVKYPSFPDKETFIHMMVWQLALLKQDYLIETQNSGF